MEVDYDVFWRQIRGDSFRPARLPRRRRGRGPASNLARLDRHKLEKKKLRKPYESLPRDNAKRILQGKPLAAKGLLPEGTYAFRKGLYERDGVNIDL